MGSIGSDKHLKYSTSTINPQENGDIHLVSYVCLDKTNHDTNYNMETGSSITSNHVTQVSDNKIPKTQDNPGHLRESTRTEQKTDVQSNGATGGRNGTPSHRDLAHPDADDHTDQVSCREKIFSWRVAIFFLLHSSCIIFGFPTTTLAMSFVCMDDRRAAEHQENNTIVDSMISQVGSKADNFTSLWNGTLLQRKSPTDLSDLNWDSQVKGLVLSGVLFSGPVCAIIVNKVRQYLGNKRTVVLFALMASGLTLLTPTTARMNPYVQLGVQIILGLTLNTHIPIMVDTMAWWTPDSEKLTAAALAFAGITVSVVVSSFFAGLLCLVPVDNGWPFIFYVYGVTILIWIVAFYVLYARKPEEHPFISDREKKHIIAKRTGMPSEEDQRQNKTLKDRIPYKTIFTSIPVLIFCTVATIHKYSMSITFIYLPIYFNNVLGFRVDQTGTVFAMITSLRFIGTTVWTIIGNVLVSVGGLTKHQSRKICICIGMFGASGFSFAVSFFNEDQRWAAIGFILLYMMFQSVGTSAIASLPSEMAPRYGAAIFSNFYVFGAAIAATSPIVVAAITPNNSYNEWRFVWMLITGLYGCSGTVYLLGGQAKLQPWADPEEPSNKNVSARSNFEEIKIQNSPTTNNKTSADAISSGTKADYKQCSVQKGKRPQGQDNYGFH